MGGWAAPSPNAGNSEWSHPGCRWDQQQLGKSPLTDLNQLITITNYTNRHWGGGCLLTEWQRCQLCFPQMKLVHCRDFIVIYLNSSVLLISSFFSSSHGLFLSALCGYVSRWHGESSLGSQPNGFFIVIAWRAFYLPQTHRQALIAISVCWNLILNKSVQFYGSLAETFHCATVTFVIFMFWYYILFIFLSLFNNPLRETDRFRSLI